MNQYIRWFSEIGIDDIPVVGGKNASLGELFGELAAEGIHVPDGFAITADAYRLFLREAQLDQKIAGLLAGIDTRNIEDLRHRGSQIRHAILEASLPPVLVTEITSAYEQLGGKTTPLSSVAVRSSATAEDLPDASFAGQQETYLNVQGIYACSTPANVFCIALRGSRDLVSRGQGVRPFQGRAVRGRTAHGALGSASAGVIFTIDTETGFRDTVLINAAYGSAKTCQARLIPDEYCVQADAKYWLRHILQKGSAQRINHLRHRRRKDGEECPRAAGQRDKFALSDVRRFCNSPGGRVGSKIYYSARKGSATPMDIERAKDGSTGELFIVQARPETVHSRKDVDAIRRTS